MKIIDKESCLIDFCTISYGTTFKCNGETYLKADISENEYGIRVNSINLKTGEMQGFDDCEKIEPLENAKIICH